MFNILGDKRCAMTAAQSRDAVSFDGMDHIWYLEYFKEWPCYVVKDERSVEYTY